jgi:hypothetical protein
VEYCVTLSSSLTTSSQGGQRPKRGASDYISHGLQQLIIGQEIAKKRLYLLRAPVACSDVGPKPFS